MKVTLFVTMSFAIIAIPNTYIVAFLLISIFFDDFKFKFISLNVSTPILARDPLAWTSNMVYVFAYFCLLGSSNRSNASGFI